MRIVSCHIENFGGLSKTDISFDKGLNIVLRENGWGKSTLAAFIKAMLYGLPATSRRSLLENDRKRLTPWNGGIFGGSMIFETDTGIYRVERFFGSKESEDTFSLFDEKTKLESKEYTEKLGIELTGLDAESFEKTVFLPQKSIEIEMTDSISAKLSDLLESSDDLNNFETAMKKLTDCRRNYAFLRGSGGKIYESEQKLHEVNIELEACERAFDSIDETQKQLNEVEKSVTQQRKELESLEKSLELSEEYGLRKANRERLISLKNGIEASQKKLSEIKEFFKDGLPTAEDSEACREMITHIAQIDAGIMALKNSVDEVTPREMRQGFFKGNEPTLDEVEHMITACGELSELSSRATEEQVLTRQKQGESLAKNKRKFVVGLMLIALGIVLSITATLAKTVVLLLASAVGAIVFAIAGICLLIGKKASTETPCGTAAQQLAETQTEIDAFLQKYELSGDRTAAVYEVKEKLTALLRVEKENSRCASEISEHQEKRALLDERVRSFLNKYGMTELSGGYASALDKISENRTKFLVEGEREATLKAELAEFLKSHDINELSAPLTPPDEDTDLIKTAIANIKHNLESMAKSSILLTQRKTELEGSVEGYNTLLSEKERLEAEIAEGNKKVRIIDATAEFLEKARASLSTRYLDRMTEGFGKYAAEICESELSGVKGIDEDFALSSKLDLTFKRDGKSRSLDFFSTGYRALAGFCMRLSLSDALYSGEQPFLVLDDPFVNLDDEKYEKVKALLNRLSQDRQIIYFVCRKE